MEGTPVVVENEGEDESEKEPQLSPLEKVLAAIRESEAKAKEKSEAKAEAEVEDAALPEAELPVERVPEEQARRIVHEMVEEPPQIETEQEEPPEPQAEEEPEPEAETEPVVEAEPVEVPEVEPQQEEAEPAPLVEENPKVVTMEAEPEEPAKIPEVEPTETPEEPEEPPAPVMSETTPEPAAEDAPEPVVAPEEKPETPSDDDAKKPGFIRSLFRRREHKAEAEAEKEVEEEPSEEPEALEPPVEKDKPEGPEFQFNEMSEEPAEAPKVEAVPEEPETEPQPEAQPAPERIGQMLLHVEDVAVEQSPQIATEALVSSKAAEEKMNVEASPTDPISGKRIDTMSRGELMDLGETIEINGNNLRHIYETHLIGERGLRRLIIEHLRGGNLQEALRREVMEHEMDFERDPVMRDLAPTADETVTSNHEALEKFLQQAEAQRADNSSTETSFTAAASQEPVRRQRTSYHYRPLDIGLAATISILILLIIIVFMSRG